MEMQELKSNPNYGQIVIICLLFFIAVFLKASIDYAKINSSNTQAQQDQLISQQAQIITLLQSLPTPAPAVIQAAPIATPDPAHVDAMRQLQSSALMLKTLAENELDGFNTNCFDASITGIYQQQFCAQQFQVEQLSIISGQLYNLAAILTK
jgi:hypothetical protein